MSKSKPRYTSQPAPDDPLIAAREVLRVSGLSDEALTTAVRAGPHELARTVARYLTFPGRRYLRAAEVYERSGVSSATADLLWRAMGFPEVPDDAESFTDGDVDALRLASTLFERAGLDVASGLQQARHISQAMMRIAVSQQDVIASVLDEPDPMQSGEKAVALARDALPAMDHLLLYLYRRHLAAATEQQLMSGSAGMGALTVSVGFADLVGFTRISQLLSTSELGHLIEGFNSATAAVIVEGGGRVIKTIGDEVMFTASNAEAGAAIALGLIGAVSPSSGYPELRVGLATGEVLARDGDVFGSAVNLASRLVAIARAGTALVDSATRDALGQDSPFSMSAVAPQRVRGLGDIRCWRLRDRPAANPAGKV